MSVIKVNAITNVAGSGEVEVQLPLKLKEVSEPSAPSQGHGLLFIDTADDELKYRHAGVNSGNSVTLSTSGVSLSSANEFTRGQTIDGGQNEVQLKIQGFSTQTTNPFEVTTSADADLFTVSNVGDVGITNNLALNTDASVFSMGIGSDFTITHDNDIGATIAGSPITITAAEASTWSTSAGVLTISGKTGLNLQEDGTNVISINTDRDIVIGNSTSTETISIGHTTSETTVNDNLTVTGNLEVDGVLDNTKLQSYKETIDTVVQNAATVTLDMNDANVFYTVLTENCTAIQFDNMVAGHSATWIVKNAAAGGSAPYDVTFGTVKIGSGGSDIGKFPSGEEPQWTDTVDAVDIFTFFAQDISGDGTVDNIYVMVGGLNFGANS
tara:strand:- start:27584 stop:28732 length:1149 start_codon:yes stop_codon:yes gene_type:complete